MRYEILWEPSMKRFGTRGYALHGARFGRKQKRAKEKSPCKSRTFLASPARFERATFRLGGERSILLSYGENRYFAPYGARGFFEPHIIIANRGGVVKGKMKVYERRDNFVVRADLYCKRGSGASCGVIVSALPASGLVFTGFCSGGSNFAQAVPLSEQKLRGGVLRQMGRLACIVCRAVPSAASLAVEDLHIVKAQ